MSIFKKKKGSESTAQPHDANKLDVSTSGKKLSPRLSTKSFRKVVKLVKLTSGGKKSRKLEVAKDEDVDMGELSVESGSEDGASPDNSVTPQRPSNIALQPSSSSESSVATTSSTPGPSGDISAGTPTFQRCASDDFVHVSLPSKAAVDSVASPSQTASKISQTAPTLPKLPETKESPTSPPPTFSTPQALEGEEEFFSINEMHVCIYGQWLCVSNTGGMVMAFEFQLKDKKTPKV